MIGLRRELAGKTALITGAAHRLGRHLALSLGRAGADVVVHYQGNEEKACSVVAELENMGRKAWALQADFLKRGEAQRLADDALTLTGGYQILINNVGNYLVKDLLGTTAQEWRDLFETNLIAPQILIRSFVEQLPSDHTGHILNLGYAGVETIRPHLKATAYQASKTSLLVLTKSYAELLAGCGIRVNMISPGHLDNSIDLPENLAAEIPIGRAGRLADIEDALHYLLDFEGYVTGINLDVAGGYRL